MSTPERRTPGGSTRALSLVAAVAALTIACVSCGPALASQTSFYAGAGLGYGHMQAAFSAHLPSGTEVITFDGLGGNGPVATALAGLERDTGVMRFALELDGALLGVESTLDGGFGGYWAEGDLTLGWSASLSALVGLEISETGLLFGRVGYGTTSYTATIRSNIGNIDDEPWGDVQAVVLGLGLEGELGGGWSLRGEFRYSTFEDFHEGKDGLELVIKPSTYAAGLSVIRRF